MNGIKSSLYLAPVASGPARYACKNWHYLAVPPAGKCFSVGVWEDGAFIGAVMFNRGNINIGKQLGLLQREIVHLARVALRDHKAPVSRILRIAVNILKAHNPGIRAIRAYSWLGAGHLGGIYQASNWTYLGEKATNPYFRVHAKVVHSRTLGVRHKTLNIEWLRQNVDKDIEKVYVEGKHVYMKALDPSLQPLLDSFRKPYPKRAKDSSEPPGIPAGRGRGSTDPHAPLGN